MNLYVITTRLHDVHHVHEWSKRDGTLYIIIRNTVQHATTDNQSTGWYGVCTDHLYHLSLTAEQSSTSLHFAHLHLQWQANCQLDYWRIIKVTNCNSWIKDNNIRFCTADNCSLQLRRETKCESRHMCLYQSINQSKRIYIAPYVAGESEARVGLG